MKKYKSEFITGLGIVIMSLLFIYLFEVVAPFILALILAFASLPVIKFFQKGLKNQSLSTVAFLIGILGVTVLFFVILGGFISRDFQRFNDGFSKLASDNQEHIDAFTTEAYELINSFYDLEDFDITSKKQVDSLVNNISEKGTSEFDIDAIKEGFGNVTSFFKTDKKATENDESSFSWFAIILGSFTYYLLILFNVNYFVGVRKRYFGKKLKGKMSQVLDDFNNSFLRYFKLRSRIVVLLLLIYLIAFVVLDVPGISLFLLLILLLSFIPYLQYLVLIPLALSCFILSIETDQSFLFYYGICVGVFVLASLIEEIFLVPNILEANMGMNPAIMVLAISIGGFVFGLPGVFLGVPLASLLIIYVKRYFLEPWMKVVD
ncbi:MAG: AI-2E family transporter [Bacteroidia bacterium]